MKLSPKYFRVRLTLLLAPLISLTLLALCGWGYTEYSVTRDELNSATLIADKLYFTTESEKRWTGYVKVYRSLNIHLVDQPFIIRIGDNFNPEPLDTAFAKFPNGGTVEILYDADQLRDSILHNPHEIKINGEAIIGLADTKDTIMWVGVCAFGAALVFGFVALIAFRSYSQLMWKGDKAIYKESKWIFVKRWFRE